MKAEALAARITYSNAAKFLHSPDTDIMPFVYILGTSTPRGPISYVGWTLDLERRLAQHNAGTGARTTRGRAWLLLHSESFDTREAAMSREWHLKRDRKFRKELLSKFATSTRPHSEKAAKQPSRRTRAAVGVSRMRFAAPR